MARPMTEQVILIFTGLVCAVILAQVVLLTIALWINPKGDFDGLARALETEVQILLGAILGYATGRKVSPPE